MSTYDKEALAILEALKKWRHYFLDSDLIIKTDQKSLKYITEQKVAEGIQHKLLLKLLQFNYTIEYKKGKENKAADALSRRDSNLLSLTVIQPTWTESVEHSYIQDTQCQELLQKLCLSPTAHPPITLNAGLLRYKGRIYIGKDAELRKQIMHSFHASVIGGHSGIVASYQRLKRLFYWPGMKKELTRYISECPVCQRAKAEHCQYPGLLDPLDPPDMAWQHITMDFVEGLPKSQGKEVILVVVDRMTKLAHFIALSHPYTAHLVAEAFLANIFKLHGPPASIITDRDRIFTSQLWQEVFKAMQVKLKLSTAYHPHTDGQSERVNQCLESYLRCMVFQEPKKWASWLPMAEWWYNTSYHTAIKLSLFQALYGYPPPMLSEFSIPIQGDTEAQDFLMVRQQMLTHLKENLSQAQARMKKYADLKRTERKLDIGDMVYIKMQPYRMAAFGIRQSIKLTSKFYGPFRVLEQIGKLAYKLQLVTQWLVEWVNLPASDASWEDARFIKTIFPDFYTATIKAWFPDTNT
jgi:transposase InsO family protein